jgi:hypothetical protein
MRALLPGLGAQSTRPLRRMPSLCFGAHEPLLIAVLELRLTIAGSSPAQEAPQRPVRAIQEHEPNEDASPASLVMMAI